ncbi:MAG TPA: TIGR04255 family protein [bacterium]|nr:TIGR04255 family protein [bacterium]MDX9805048.1 TIGR04255 family protein [bacterium]HOB70601.1 TIGR04255 family protein [bacterium]HOG42817.1 TIGR04255 family protein [bacterium]HPG35944.1 TIGR04255 family protein [bacterium]
MKKYNNPPIKEAIFDIRFNERISEGDIQKISETFFKEVEKEFPDKKLQRSFEENITINPDGERKIESKNEITGYLFWSGDKKEVVQTRIDGFAYNILEKYENWEFFSKKAMNLFNVLKKVDTERTISRIALKYINVINLPLDNLKISDYISNMPPMCDEFPQTMKGFILKTHFVENDVNIINIEKILPLKDNILPFVIDIDVFVQNPSFEKADLQKRMEELRKTKNRIFELCITEKTRSLFR